MRIYFCLGKEATVRNVTNRLTSAPCTFQWFTRINTLSGMRRLTMSGAVDGWPDVTRMAKTAIVTLPSPRVCLSPFLFFIPYFASFPINFYLRSTPTTSYLDSSRVSSATILSFFVPTPSQLPIQIDIISLLRRCERSDRMHLFQRYIGGERGLMLIPPQKS